MKTLLTLCLILGVSPALFAQAPFPGGVLVNGGWVPCTHPIATMAGLGCGTDRCLTVNTVTVCDSTVQALCRTPFDAYTQQDRAAACAAFMDRYLFVPPDRGSFTVGARYQHPYGGVIVVLGLAHDLKGEQVVTAQWVEGPYTGQLHVFWNLYGTATFWTPVP